MESRRGRRNRGSAPAVVGRIEHALEVIAPLLPGKAVVQLVRFEQATGVAELRVLGDCPDCSMPASVFSKAIEAMLRRSVAEVTSVHIREDHEI